MPDWTTEVSFDIHSTNAKVRVPDAVRAALGAPESELSQ